VVEAVDQQYGTVAEIAEIFDVTERYIYKLTLRDRGEKGVNSPV